MAKTATAKPQTTETVETQEALANVVTLVPAPEPTADLATLRAQAKALNDKIKELKAAEPKRSRLEAEIERQAVPPKTLVWQLESLLSRRVNAGQTKEDAINAIAEQCRGIMEAWEQKQ
jgi:hypothetical protein